MSAITAHNRKFLIFSLHDTLYALDLAQVAEVDDPPRMWPIPLAPACYSGALNFHGDIVAVMDLAIFLGLAASGHPGKMVVLHQEVAALAFLVDTIVRIVPAYEVSFAPPPGNGIAASTLILAEGEALLLDLKTLVLEAEIGMQRSP